MTARFWQNSEKFEEDLIRDLDEARFRRRMRRIGHDDATIADRVEAVREFHTMLFGVPSSAIATLEPRP